MNTAAVVTFLIIASFIWGGLVLLVATAMRRESAKGRVAPSSAVPPASRPTPPDPRATES